MLIKIFSFIWAALKEITGLNGETEHFWNVSFERKVLDGNVGLPIKWPSRYDSEVLWATETVIQDICITDTTDNVKERIRLSIDHKPLEPTVSSTLRRRLSQNNPNGHPEEDNPKPGIAKCKKAIFNTKKHVNSALSKPFKRNDKKLTDTVSYVYESPQTPNTSSAELRKHIHENGVHETYITLNDKKRVPFLTIKRDGVSRAEDIDIKDNDVKTNETPVQMQSYMNLIEERHFSNKHMSDISQNHNTTSVIEHISHMNAHKTHKACCGTSVDPMNKSISERKPSLNKINLCTEQQKGFQTNQTKSYISKTSMRNPVYDIDPNVLDEVKCLQNGHKNCDFYDGATFLQGKEAFEYYQRMAAAESVHNINQMKQDKTKLTEMYAWKKKILMELINTAKDYYSNPTGERRRRWMALKEGLPTRRSTTDVRTQVSMRRDRFPFFTVNLMLCQIIVLVILCVRFGLDQACVISYQRVQHYVPTILGVETIVDISEPNPFLGPPERFFWVSGAAVGVCMIRKNVPMTPTEVQHLDLDRFGCCEMGGHINSAGTSTLSECTEMTSDLGTWRRGVLCSDRVAPQNTVAHVIKPCCVTPTASCRMVSHEHCLFLKGIFHLGVDHCIQVNCLNSLCSLRLNEHNAALPGDETGMLGKMATPSWLSWLKLPFSWYTSPEAEYYPNHWWRLFTALPQTFGVFQLLLVLAVEAVVMVPMERCAGWCRVGLIWAGSAIAGIMFAVSVEPYRPHTGGIGGVSGFVGVAWLELIQAWEFLPRGAWFHLLNLCGATVVFLVMGTLHLISLAAVIAGGVVGSSLALLFLPYINFGRRLFLSRKHAVPAGLVLFLSATTLIGYAYTSSLAALANTLTDPLSLNTNDLVLGHTKNWLLGLIYGVECVRYTDDMCLTYYSK